MAASFLHDAVFLSSIISSFFLYSPTLNLIVANFFDVKQPIQILFLAKVTVNI